MLDFEREALKLYNEGKYKDFRGFVHDDININFFGPEFAEFNNIDGQDVLSILVNDVRGVAIPASEESGSEGVMRSNVILYCRYGDISGLAQNQSVRVNDILYTVKEFHAVKNFVWRILLERNE